MKNIKFKDFEYNDQKSFEDSKNLFQNPLLFKEKKLNHTLSPVFGKKIKGIRSNKSKLKLKVTMPKIPQEKTNDSKTWKYFSCVPKVSLTPTNFFEKKKIRNFSPVGIDSNKKIRHQKVSKYKKQSLPKVFEITNMVIKTDSNIYSELLAWLIKIQVEFLPIYQKIDLQRKGKIEYSDLENFIFRYYPILNPSDCFQTLSYLNFFMSKEISITKKNFLALCTVIKNSRYAAKDFKSIFIEPSLESLTEIIKKVFVLFNKFTDTKFVEIGKVLGLKDFFEEKSQKSLKIVFSEPVDMPRFMTCLPFFKWVLMN